MRGGGCGHMKRRSLDYRKSDTVKVPKYIILYDLHIFIPGLGVSICIIST